MVSRRLFLSALAILFGAVNTAAISFLPRVDEVISFIEIVWPAFPIALWNPG